MDGAPLRPSSPQWRRTPPTASVTPHNETGGGLLAIKLLDQNRVKPEGLDLDTKHITLTTSMATAPTPALSSPRHPYSGPPPPYSYASSAAPGVPLGISGYASPPDSRRTSDDDKDKPSQSLPSIHEALGKDHGSIYSSAPPAVSHHANAPQPNITQTPTTPAPRSHPEPTLSGPPNPYAMSQHSQQLPPYSSESVDRRPLAPQRPAPSTEEPAHVSRRMSAQDSAPYSAHAHSTSSPAPLVGQSPRLMHPTQHPSPLYHPPTQAPAAPSALVQAPGYRSGPVLPPGSGPVSGPVSGPASGPSAGYSFPPPPPPSLSSAFAGYQPPHPVQSYWRVDGSEMDRVEEMRKAAPKQNASGSQRYGESVKRQLDKFDLEMSLNEIEQGCGRGMAFAREFGDRAHQSQRSDLTVASMPTLAECDDMLQRQQRVLASIANIKEVVIAQQHALAEQRSREEAHKIQQGDFREDPNMLSREADGANAFGADSKRRRGRNAPPGRCHSCNRAETPEWRRGPDGARTLCNACGLHYAKLTRKMGTKAAIGSSNLRPKENGSP